MKKNSESCSSIQLSYGHFLVEQIRRYLFKVLEKKLKAQFHNGRPNSLIIILLFNTCKCLAHLRSRNILFICVLWTRIKLGQRKAEHPLATWNIVAGRGGVHQVIEKNKYVSFLTHFALNFVYSFPHALGCIRC